MVKKYLLKLNNCCPDIQQTIRRNSTNLSPLMYELCSCKRLKLYSLKLAIAHAQIKIVMLIKFGLNCIV